MRNGKRLVSICSCFGLAFFLAACVTTRSENLRTSVASLAAASNHFYSQARYEGDDSYRDRVSRYAEALSKAAERLDRAVDKGDSRDAVEEEYRRVVDHYGQLQDRLAAEGYADQSRRLLASFDEVTSAYHDVQSAMSARTASERDRLRY